MIGYIPLKLISKNKSMIPKKRGRTSKIIDETINDTLEWGIDIPNTFKDEKNNKIIICKLLFLSIINMLIIYYSYRLDQ